MPDRVTLDLSTDKMSELKLILDDLHKAKDTIHEFTKVKDLETKSKRFQLRYLGTTWAAGFATHYAGGDHLSSDKLVDLDKKKILPHFEKYHEFVDPEYLTNDLDRVDRIFASFFGGPIAVYIHDRIEKSMKKKIKKEEND